MNQMTRELWRSCRSFLADAKTLLQKPVALPTLANRKRQRQQQDQVSEQAQEADDDEEVNVRLFELDPRRGRKPVPVKSFDDEETRSIKARIDRLEKELQDMRPGGVLAKAPYNLSSTQENHPGTAAADEEKLRQTFKDPELARDLQLLHRLSKSIFGKKEVASDGSEDISRSTVKIATRREQRVYLKRLNAYLRQAEAMGSEDPDIRKQLWRWYTRCRQNIPAFLSHVTQPTLQALWDAQAVASISNPDRAAHLKLLAQDMATCGFLLSISQKTAHIEALYLEGDQAQAISEWRATAESAFIPEQISRAFQTLGVRMLIGEGDVKQAHRIAYECLNSGKVKDARILIPVIDGWNRKGEESAFRRAWAAYIRLKEDLGPAMTMDDFDAVCKSFLDVHRADLGLGVFKDMMLAGDPSSDETSPVLFRKALGTVDDLRAVALDAPELNQISLEAMSVLPRRWQNKYFYGSWIKKLLGAGDTHSAELVIELMMNRGVRADAKYLNGLIGAWIRERGAESCEKAEKLAWEMIEERKRFAAQRRATNRGEDVPSPVSDEQIIVADSSADLRTTPASTETFSIMIDHYLGRESHDQIRWLNRSITLAEIVPSAFFMNCLMQSQLRTDGLRRVWHTYTEWAHASFEAAKPTLETFEFLWQCAHVRTGRTRPPPNHELAMAAPDGEDRREAGETQEDAFCEDKYASEVAERLAARRETGFPSPRGLFSDMMEWYLQLRPREQSTARAEFSDDLYNKIIRCFLLDGGGDLVGSLVAMHAFKRHFQRWSQEETAKMLMVHIAGRERPTMRRSDANRMEALAKVSQLLSRIARRRMVVLEKHGIEDGDLDERFAAEENLYLLSELVWTVVGSRRDIGAWENSVQRAAWDMGVGGINVGDHLQNA
ncbi:MAG: hypothetical protein M1826_004416 [Phylliscum demangeonii]|nr:MAG: hypothetical protein M1826_004416 [Phylliscum demangeonii]